MRLISLFLLIQLAVINVLTQTRTGGVTPTYKIPSLPYFIIQKLTLIPSTFGAATNLISSGNPYSLTIPFVKLMPSVNQSNVVTIGYSSSTNGNIAYIITNTLTGSSTSMEIQLSILGSSSFVKFSLSIIRTSDSLLQGNSYIVLFEISSNGPANPGSISMPDFTGYEIYPFVKFMSIVLNDTLPGSPQSEGFTTKYEIKNTTGSGVMLNVWVERDDVGANFFTLSVTWVVILINPISYKQTAQFSSLIHIAQQSTTTSGTPVTIQDYSSTYQTKLLIGTSSFIQITPYSSSIDYTLATNTITFITNSLTLQYLYLLIQLVDYACPSDTPYRYKNDTLCYSCTIGTEMFVNNVSFTEYNSAIVDERCKLIIRTNTGYAFDKAGQISAICAYCKECYVQYYLQNGKCYECRAKVPNCEECTANAVCIKCTAGFNLVDIDNDPLTNNSICQKTVSCGVNCLTCNTNASSCTTCVSGFKIVDPDSSSVTENSYCVKECSQNNCLSCSLDGSSCNQCNTGFKKVFDSLSGTTRCQVICPTNCADCSSGTSCNTCDSGYKKIVDSLSGIIRCQIICSSNCLQCTISSCTKCQAGYIVTPSAIDPSSSNLTCQVNPISCDSNCLQCLSTTSCKTCKIQFTLNNSQCIAVIKCSPNCTICNANGSSCLTCQEGYNLVDIDQNHSTDNLICKQQQIPPISQQESPPVSLSSDNNQKNKNITIVAVVIGVVMLVGLVGIVGYVYRMFRGRQVFNYTIPQNVPIELIPSNVPIELREDVISDDDMYISNHSDAQSDINEEQLRQLPIFDFQNINQNLGRISFSFV